MHTTSNLSTTKSRSAAFWQNPPWQQAGGYRLGLNPVGFERWCPSKIDTAELNRKRELINRASQQVCRSDETSAGAQATVAAWLARQHPIAKLSEQSFSSETLTRLAGDHCLNLARCALTVPEDLCIMTRDGEDYRLNAACVCAPSYWHLPSKIGLPLHQVHAPVLGLNKKIGERIRQFLQRLPRDRLFLRRNWFIHDSAELFQPKSEVHSAAVVEPGDLKSMVIRSETQTLRRIDGNNILFTIRVNCYPLSDLADHPSAAKAMQESIATFNPAEYEAFGLDRLGDSLRVYLAEILQQ